VYQQLKCKFTFNAQQSLEVSVGNSPFSASTAYHVACIYDGQQMCLYINGASKTCSSIKSVFTEGSADKLRIGSDGTTSWGGTIDEVRAPRGYQCSATSRSLTSRDDASSGQSVRSRADCGERGPALRSLWSQRRAHGPNEYALRRNTQRTAASLCDI
jgi:hypothetical protein